MHPHRPRRLSRRTTLERAQQAVAALGMPPADWNKVYSVAGTWSWRGLLVRAAVRTIAAGGELHHVLRGRGWAARDRYRAYYARYFRTESRLLHVLAIAALCAAPRGPQDDDRTRRQLRRQAKGIQTAYVDAGFFKKETDEKAARDCVRITVGLLHHLVSGTPLPADCSAGSDW